MILCPNAGGECVSSLCEHGSCWKKQQEDQSPAITWMRPPKSIDLYEALARHLDVPLDTLMHANGLNRATLQFLEKATGDDLAYAPPSKILDSIDKYLKLNIVNLKEVTLSPCMIAFNDPTLYPELSPEALKGLTEFTRNVKIKVKVNQHTGECRLLAINGHLLNCPM